MLANVSQMLGNAGQTWKHARRLLECPRAAREAPATDAKRVAGSARYSGLMLQQNNKFPQWKHLHLHPRHQCQATESRSAASKQVEWSAVFSGHKPPPNRTRGQMPYADFEGIFKNGCSRVPRCAHRLWNSWEQRRILHALPGAVWGVLQSTHRATRVHEPHGQGRG